MLITNEGVIIRMSLENAKDIGRNTSGVRFMNIDPNSDVVVASIAKVRESTTEASQDENQENQSVDPVESEYPEEKNS